MQRLAHFLRVQVGTDILELELDPGSLALQERNSKMKDEKKNCTIRSLRGVDDKGWNACDRERNEREM